MMTRLDAQAIRHRRIGQTQQEGTHWNGGEVDETMEASVVLTIESYTVHYVLAPPPALGFVLVRRKEFHVR